MVKYPLDLRPQDEPIYARGWNNAETNLKRIFARYLAPHYLRDYTEIARLCDEELDRSGALLGYVREEASKISSGDRDGTADNH